MNNFHNQEYSTFLLLLEYIVFNIFIGDEVDFIQISYGEYNLLWILSLDNRLKSQKEQNNIHTWVTLVGFRQSNKF